MISGREGTSLSADDFYRYLRDRIAGYSGPYADYVLLMPDLIALVSRLMLDRRVETRHKAYLGAALAYAVSPVDLLPESRLGVIGYLDDLVVLVAVLDILLNEVDQQVVLEHWSGSRDLLSDVQRVVSQADQLVGKGRLEKILDAIGIRRPTPGQPA